MDGQLWIMSWGKNQKKKYFTFSVQHVSLFPPCNFYALLLLAHRQGKEKLNWFIFKHCTMYTYEQKLFLSKIVAQFAQ